MLLGSGRDCPRCEEKQTDRRAQHQAAAATQPAYDVPAAPVAPGALPAPRPAVVPAREPEFADVERGPVLGWRNRAAADDQLGFDQIDRYGELSAPRLFTRAFTAQVQRLASLGHLDLGCTTLGAGVSGGETSGACLAQVAVRTETEREAARKNGTGPKAKRYGPGRRSPPAPTHTSSAP
ncbi:hypothetical protein [Streptomyces sp. NPDC090025]|uniref:hypothetical protein n=1 Tax=Streptomyces sp. NPDC090025 TaxID=3365922 RepID=UPI003836462D